MVVAVVVAVVVVDDVSSSSLLSLECAVSVTILDGKVISSSFSCWFSSSEAVSLCLSSLNSSAFSSSEAVSPVISSSCSSSASSSSHRSMLVRAQQAMVITERLIVAAVSDPDPRLRAAVLSTFANDSRYDAYLHPNIHNNDHQRRLTELLGLGSLDNLRSLFVCLNDESLAARRASICILGR